MDTNKIKIVVLDKVHVELIREILENKKDELVCVSATSKNLQYGQYLIAENEDFNEEERLFRLVQIREGKGFFGSDIYIGRLPDGRIITYNEPTVSLIDPKYIERLNVMFDCYDSREIDDEHEQVGYRIGKNSEFVVGFYINKK